MNTVLLFVVIGLELYRFYFDRKWREQMKNDFSALTQTVADAEKAIDDADVDINNLINQIGQTSPDDQKTIDDLNARLRVKIAALIAATNQTPPTPASSTKV